MLLVGINSHGKLVSSNLFDDGKLRKSVLNGKEEIGLRSSIHIWELAGFLS